MNISKASHRRGGGQNDSLGDPLSAFECPVCFDYSLPPIYQCQAGHLICSFCLPRLSCCPTCRGPLSGNIRNLAMEQVAKGVFFPCKYSISGCDKCFLHTEKKGHEMKCEWRPYNCPCPGTSCKWQGTLEQVMPHLFNNHKPITTLEGDDIIFLATDINLPGTVDWVMIQSCYGHYFMLVLEKQHKHDGPMFYASVHLIGSEENAKKFSFRMEISGNGGRYSCEVPPRSIHAVVSTDTPNFQCLTFGLAVARVCSENGNLSMSVVISRKDCVVQMDDDSDQCASENQGLSSNTEPKPN